ncbi:MAG: hypothetical protein AAFX92_22510 [Pseudomonadota bacterium]
MKLRASTRDLAIILPFGALAIFLPPYLRVFDQPVAVYGIPLLPLAIFVAWLVGIVLTLLLARRLTRTSAADVGADRASVSAGDGQDKPPEDR